MNLTRVSFLMFASLVILPVLNPALAHNENQKIFDAIPVSQRERFISRLNIYVEYLLKHKRELETFYDEETLCSLCKGTPKCIDDCPPPMKVDFPEGYTEDLLAFRPRSVKPDRPNEKQYYSIEIEEQDRVSWKGKRPWIRKRTVHVYAVYERSDWYFSLVAVPGRLLM